MISGPKPGPLILAGVLVAVLGISLCARTAFPSERILAMMEISELRVQPTVVLSGEPVVIHAVIRNRGSSPVRSVFSATAISTDFSPGIRWSLASESEVRGLPVLAPGTEVSVTNSVIFDGDGWVRIGLLAWNAEENLRPVSRRVLVVNPVLSTIELVTLLGMLAFIGASGVALISWLIREPRRADISRGRRLRLAGALVVVAAALWVAASFNLRAVTVESLRLLTYGGIVSLVGGWFLALEAFAKAARLRRLVVEAALYLLFGLAWTVVFYAWLGARPTHITPTPQFWVEALLWPLQVAQALFGLRFG